jgi:hypothetical protein
MIRMGKKIKEEPKKTKYLLKAHIKLHPTIQKPINKGTEFFSIILIAFIVALIGYLLIDTIFIKHPESPRPTDEEIEQICDSKNMESYGYFTDENPKEILGKNHTTRTYIICKTRYLPPNHLTKIKLECVTKTYYNYYTPQNKDIGCSQKVTFDNTDYWECKIKRCNTCPENPTLIDGLLQNVCDDEKQDGLGGEGSSCHTCSHIA